MKLKRGGVVCFTMIFGSKSPPVILFGTRNSHWYTLFPLKTTYSKGISHCQISGGYTVYPLRQQTYCGYKTHKTWLILTYQWYSQWFCWCWWLVRTGDDGGEITLLKKPIFYLILPEHSQFYWFAASPYPLQLPKYWHMTRDTDFELALMFQRPDMV